MIKVTIQPLTRSFRENPRRWRASSDSGWSDQPRISLQDLARHSPIVGGPIDRSASPAFLVDNVVCKADAVAQQGLAGVVVLAATPIGDVADASPRLVAELT